MRILSILFLTFFATTASASWQQIKDRAAFDAAVVGHSYVDSRDNWFQFHPDGTLTGGALGKELTGTWRYRNGMACFNRALGGQDLPNDCIVVLIDGDKLVTVRERGTGRQTQYTKR